MISGLIPLSSIIASGWLKYCEWNSVDGKICANFVMEHYFFSFKAESVTQYTTTTDSGEFSVFIVVR